MNRVRTVEEGLGLGEVPRSNSSSASSVARRYSAGGAGGCAVGGLSLARATRYGAKADTPTSNATVQDRRGRFTGGGPLGSAYPSALARRQSRCPSCRRWRWRWSAQMRMDRPYSARSGNAARGARGFERSDGGRRSIADVGVHPLRALAELAARDAVLAEQAIQLRALQAPAPPRSRCPCDASRLRRRVPAKALLPARGPRGLRPRAARPSVHRDARAG